MSSFAYPWAIEGKATPFARYMRIGIPVRTLEEAVREELRLRASHHYYALRVRAR